MGRVVTPKYALELVPESTKIAFTPMAWKPTEYGKPDAHSLAHFVARFEASTQPGGANAHLGPTRIVYARIKRNVKGGETVAEYRPAPTPVASVPEPDTWAPHGMGPDA